ncbi:hypothetical protein UCRPC4_g00289 [Phaeomoniella chlamydospora]|uniref:Ubiquitin-like domain-containing protein n=1 Tax=Phaeomoniella chlamydospora TaxID=158046 RepID=A0A0G2F3M1_PHACM|nr:hypothetical protein UCRPC4_g00289 [Phaeomoniella chlamydospora]
MDSLKPPDSNKQNVIEPVHITVRFSASLPDLPLTIDNPVVSTTAGLKQLIRKHLPSDLSDKRLRLIYAGKALIDTSALSTQLKLPSSRTPSRTSTPLPPQHDIHLSDSKDKGKTPIYDPPTPSRIYIHCSVGDVTLSSTDLALEATQSTLLVPNTKSQNASFTSNPSTLTPSPVPQTPTTRTRTTTTPAPRGFDRLLLSGFTHEEIRLLRSQFLAIQAHSHTPDTMPSPSTLRALEDRWLDNDSTNDLRNPSDTDTTAAATATGLSLPGTQEDASNALDDLLWGAVMGFFWPVGCLWWVCREEGIWSARLRWAVFLGVVINVGVGGLRWLS